MQKEKPVYFRNREEWREWLSKNHGKEKDVWILLYKKHTGRTGLTYKEGVEEALCFGWIDGIMKRIDDEKHMQRFSPRTSKSVWSKINKDLALRLIKEERMTPAGLEAIKVAKKNSNWQKAYTSLKSLPIPKDLYTALKKEKAVLKNFKNFATSYRNIYIGWVNMAKTKATKKKRIQKVVEHALNNKKSFY